MVNINISRIPERCEYCKAKPSKVFLGIKFHFFAPSSRTYIFICDDHEDKAIAEVYEKG